MNNKSNLKFTIAIAAAIFIVVAAVLAALLFSPSRVSVVVPWNKDTAVDIVMRGLTENTELGGKIKNVHGANGTLGLNEVFESPRDGKTLLGTNMSAFVTARYMGFTESECKDWDIWIMAFAPSIVAVKSDSPYESLEDLLSAEGIICANAGNGTLSFIAANLFAEKANLNCEHVAFSSANLAMNAVSRGNADFIVATSYELNDKLRFGEFRALAAFTQDSDMPSVAETIPELEKIMPFGESYALMFPSGVKNKTLQKVDKQLNNIKFSEEFNDFMKKKGLLSLDYTREQSALYALKMESIICNAMYDTGYINILPNDLGILKNS